MEKISIIIPVYSVEPYLKRCVDSVINQSYKNLEIILVDDESPDNCGLICDEYAKKDSRIKVVHQKNKGVSGARNSGLNIATGDYIGFVDSDDWLEPDMYQSLIYEILRTDSEIAICGVLESNQTRKPTKANILTQKILDKKGLLYEYLDNRFYVVKNLYSRHIIKKLRFDETIPFTEDIVFGIDVVELTNKAVCINSAYYNYYIENTTSLTKTNYNKKIFSTIDANLYLQNKAAILFPNDDDLNEKIRKIVLENALYHYLQLHKNVHLLDTNPGFVRKVKLLIKQNFKWSDDISLFLVIARFLGLYPFKFFFHLYHNFSNKKNDK